MVFNKNPTVPSCSTRVSTLSWVTLRAFCRDTRAVWAFKTGINFDGEGQAVVVMWSFMFRPCFYEPLSKLVVCFVYWMGP